MSDLDDAEAALAERLDGADYRDDVLRLLFICCHPDLPADPADRAGPAHRLGPDGQADRPRLPGRRERHGAADHPRQGQGRQAPACPSRRPAPVERVRAARRRWRPWSTWCSTRAIPRRRLEPARARPLCDEAIRLARLLLRLFPTEPEIMGLAAADAAAALRAARRASTPRATPCCWTTRTASLWNRTDDRRRARP